MPFRCAAPILLALLTASPLGAEIQQGYLLEADLAAIVERAGRHWDLWSSNGDKR